MVLSDLALPRRPALGTRLPQYMRLASSLSLSASVAPTDMLTQLERVFGPTMSRDEQHVCVAGLQRTMCDSENTRGENNG